jgi:hypothetical protein
MKVFISIFFIFLCFAAEVAQSNISLYSGESTRSEERAGEIEGETQPPVFKVRTSVRLDANSNRTLLSRGYSSRKSEIEIESETVKIQHRLHALTHQGQPVYLVKKVFLI